jgi:NADH-quinone oxidoreductase subunit L
MAFVFDQRLVDGAVDGVGHVVRLFAAALRPLQSGFVRQYATVMGAGAVALVGWFLLRSMW